MKKKWIIEGKNFKGNKYSIMVEADTSEEAKDIVEETIPYAQEEKEPRCVSQEKVQENGKH